jgi:(1->4)-alpha-D-glucan 1-alpha-D-glucosylmutase
MRIPSSTYRIQLHAGFTFRKLASILDYLHELGISTIYAAPITKAIQGSQHGYDATDPLSINPEIGTEEELRHLHSLLDKYGMSWLQDIVPNHMAFTDSNPWLYDLLERGKDSEYFSFFDIDTESSDELVGDKLMAPFLGSTLTECLQKGELTLDFTDRGFIIRYYENTYPVAISLYAWIATITEGCPPALLALFLEAEQTARSWSGNWTNARKKVFSDIYSNDEFRSFLHGRVNFFNRQPPLLASLAGSQHYILTHAHLAASRINYRRFFTVNSLICLRMEDETVFNAWHERIHTWYRNGFIQGLRVDHIDGLAEPRKYVDRLRQRFGDDCFIIAEKILEEGEQLPANWQLQGMTGYEFLSPASQVLTDPDGSRDLRTFYNEHITATPSYEDLVFRQKYHFLLTNMGGELDNLLRLLYSLPQLGAESHDQDRMRTALALLLSSFPVYRLYPEDTPFPPASRAILAMAFARSREKGRQSTPELSFLEGLFERHDAQHLRFQTRFMQFTSPLAAKGIEDTTFYIYHPYIAHNEVGDTPAIAGIPPESFHQKMTERRRTLPFSLNATSTHDTKRGEDSRIRLNILSAIPDQWIASVKKWRAINHSLISRIAEHPVIGASDRSSPTPNDEYLIYQALLGGFPEDLVVTDNFRRRFHDYLTKALREGNTNTGYIHPDEPYENRCHAFVTAILEPESPFLEDFIPFAWQIIRQSFTFSLSQLLIKLTAPGIPDIYQGSELWELSFVDPDNRRPVDFALRASLLKEIKEEEARGPGAVLAFVLANRKKGAGKLFTIFRTLAYRNAHPELFTAGDYIPVTATGPVLSFLRRHKNEWALIIVPLVRRDSPPPATFSLSLPPGAPSSWTNIFTGEGCLQDKIGSTLEKFPIALLTGQTP